MRTEYNPRADYIGTGSLDEYSFDFILDELEQLRVLCYDDQMELVFDVRGTDTTDIQSVTFDPGKKGGIVKLPADLAADYKLVILLDIIDPTQDSQFKDKGDFTLSRFEKALDRLNGQIQTLAYKASRALRIGEGISDSENFDPTIPIQSTDNQIQDIANKVIVGGLDNKSFMMGPSVVSLQAQADQATQGAIDATAQALAAAAAANAAAEAAEQAEQAGLPAGGDEFDLLSRDGGGDPIWRKITAIGYSIRYGVTVNLTGVQAIVDYIFNLTYTAPTISLGASGSGTIREKGESVSSTTLSATIGKTSNDIGEVRFYDTTPTLLDTQVAGGAIPNGGVSTYNYATPFTDTKSFFARVDDILSGGNQTIGTQSNTVTFTFVYPYYVGAGAVGLSAANVALLTKLKIVSTATVARTGANTISATAGQTIFFAYPASYGALTSILDASNFETISGWTLRTENITGLDGNAVSYRIYEKTIPVGVSTNYDYTFKR